MVGDRCRAIGQKKLRNRVDGRQGVIEL